MDGNKKLFDAARDGNIEILHKMVKENPLILVDTRLICLQKSLLNVATKSGQVNFVRELLKIDPDRAGELDDEGFRALDIAVITGNLNIVKEILSFNHKLGFLKGKDRRTPLHYAAMKGRVDIINELMSSCPDSIREVTAHGETAHHLAVKSYQFDAFRALVEWLERIGMESIIDNGDGDGNTVLHLAVSTKQHEVIVLLLTKTNNIKRTIEVNATNAKGFTPLDVLDIIIQDSHDVKVKEMLHQASASRANQLSIGTITTKKSIRHVQNVALNKHDDPSEPSENWFEYFKFKKNRDSPSDTRNTLLVVAALIATVSFQAGVTPPDGIFGKIKSGSNPPPTSPPSPPPYANPGVVTAFVGISGIFGTHATTFLFLFANSLGLTSAICIIIYLTGGFPFKRELHISLYSMMFTYGFATSAIVKDVTAEKKTLAYVLLTIAFILPFAQRWLPRWGQKAWSYGKKRATNNTFLPVNA